MSGSEKIAIIVVAYNRPEALKRLLKSLSNANYELAKDVPLIISIDKSNSNEVIAIAEDFKWNHGEKKIIVHPENLGLRKHVISCGNLSSVYENVIVLEDDLFVAPYFYDYAFNALKFYGGNDKIAGISLYSYDFNELTRQPFVPLDDGSDNYFMQIPSSWGQLWTKKQWNDFVLFYDSSESELKPSDKISDKIISWPSSSWKKYFFKYLERKEKFFVYPRISYATNFGDTGTHFVESMNTFQVSLNLGKRQFDFSDIHNSLSRYDSYYEILPEIIKKMNPVLAPYDFESDLNGAKENKKITRKYLLSVKECKKPLLSFAGQMIPSEMNVLCGNTGSYFHLAEVSDFSIVDPAKSMETAFYSKVNLNQLKRALYDTAERNMSQTISYRIGNFVLWPVKMLKKLIKH